jgi:conserved hypothetical protein
MAWVAAVWQVDEDAVEALGGMAAIRRPVDDQGFYANPAQIDAFVVGQSMVAVDTLVHLGTQVWVWRVEEHVPKPGTESCEVAMVSLMRRNPAMTHAAFAEHWTQNHAPLASRRHVGLHDYHQYVVAETLTANAPEIDGIAVLGFRTRADFDSRFFDSDEGRAEIMADVARFMDRPGRETTLVGPPGPMHAAG